MRITNYDIGLGSLNDCTHIRFEGISVDREEGQKIIDFCRNDININLIGVSRITKVIFNKPATIVLWEDGTKTVVKCSNKDIWNPEKGLAMCIIKKICGNDNSYHKIFKKWIPEDESSESSASAVICKIIMPRHQGERIYRNMEAKLNDILNDCGIKNFKSNFLRDKETEESDEKATKDIFKLPSAFNWDVPKCSACGYFQLVRTNYCPNCGKKTWGLDKED